jgi:hypothetical protein
LCAFHRPTEPITPPGNRRDGEAARGIFFKSLAKKENIAGEAIVLDYGIAPNLTGEFLFGNDFIAPRDQDSEGVDDLGT